MKEVSKLTPGEQKRTGLDFELLQPRVGHLLRKRGSSFDRSGNFKLGRNFA